MLGSLHRGDHILFNATLISMGDNSHLHHLHLYGIEKMEGHRDVEAHAYSNGRYKVRIEPHDGKDHSHDEPTSESFVLDPATPQIKKIEKVEDDPPIESLDT